MLLKNKLVLAYTVKDKMKSETLQHKLRNHSSLTKLFFKQLILNCRNLQQNQYHYLKSATLIIASGCDFLLIGYFKFSEEKTVMLVDPVYNLLSHAYFKKKFQAGRAKEKKSQI